MWLDLINIEKRKDFHNQLALLIASYFFALPYTMRDCVPGVTADMMRNISDSHLREETIKAANATLVNQHSQLALSQVHGAGQLSSSDGQRFVIRANSLLSSYYPRYCGYYDKAIGIYTHFGSIFSL